MPAHSGLLHGEMVAVGFDTRVGRRGQSLVGVRIVGSRSVAWVEGTFNWGARIEAIVLDNGELTDHLKSHYACTPVLYKEAIKLPPHSPWAGVMCLLLWVPYMKQNVFELSSRLSYQGTL
jgi:hypothetical protein